MKLRIINTLFIITLVLGVYVVCDEVYKTFFAPTKRIVTTYTVKHNDTWYEICNDHYVVDGNKDCFNEFWYRVMADNNNRKLYPGDVVTIVNEVYK